MNLQQLKKIAAFYARFTLSFTEVGYRVRKLSWPALKPDFKGQHWLVTGATGGLGRQIALSAAQAGATVTVAARSKEKLAQVVSDAKAMGLVGIDTEVCDFSLQSDTARFLRKVATSRPSLVREWSSFSTPTLFTRTSIFRPELASLRRKRAVSLCNEKSQTSVSMPTTPIALASETT